MLVSELDQQENNSLDAATVKHRAVLGAKVMSARTAISFVLRMISSLTLARLLFPRDYGAFGMVSGITGIAMILCDIGLGGTLMRQHREPTEDENFTVFVCQQLLTALVVSTIVLAAPFFIRAYHMPERSHLLLICMAFSMFLWSLGIIPMMCLERALRFVAIAQCELMQNVVQVVITILLAYLRFGPWALAGGTIARGVTGLAYIVVVSPWKPCGRFKFSIVKRLARYGIPLQLNSLIPALAGNWSPFVVGRLLGVIAVGFVGWAGNIASVPGMFTAVLSKIAFPAYSRLQSDTEMLNHYLRTTIKYVLALCCLIVPLTVILCPLFLPLVFKQRWVPAIPLVQWFILESAVAMVLGILSAAQNAMGYAGDRLGVTVLMAILRWTVGYLCVAHFGLAGIGPAMLTLTAFELLLTSVLVIMRNRQFNGIIGMMFMPLCGVGMILTLALWTGHRFVRQNILLQESVTLLLFAICMVLWEILAKESVIWKDVQHLIRSLRGRRRENPA